MKAGDLRFNFQYQTAVRTTDPAYNSVLVSWQNAFTIATGIRTLKAWEILKAKSVQMNASHELTCRYTPLIMADGRFTYAGRTFDINGVVNVDNRNRELVISVNEVVKANA